jgi:predicted nucleic acid-binding protein
VLGALDKAASIGRIDVEAYQITRKRFLLETRRMTRIGLIPIVPIKISILRDSWRLIVKHHIYEARALQISSAKYIGASQFLTGDK